MTKQEYIRGLVDPLIKARLSPTALSCLYTMTIAAKKDIRQELPTGYTLRDDATMKLRAQLILEETLETIDALGFEVMQDFDTGQIVLEPVAGTPRNKQKELLDIIDGCCDLIYVATGCLMSVGASDILHMSEVCRANDSKFPDGVAITDASTGKYLKPPGWKGPEHQKWITNPVGFQINLRTLGKKLADQELSL